MTRFLFLLTVILSASVWACIPASGVHDGCVTTGAQSLAGDKTFVDDIRTPDAYLGNVWTQFIKPTLYGQAVDIRGARYPDDTASTADVVVGSEVVRTAGNLLEVQNCTTPVAWVTHNGGFVSQSNDPYEVAFTQASGASGAPFGQAAEGLYMTLLGRLPDAYWGHHGAITLGNKYPMIAGYALQIINGPTTLTANYQGAIWNGAQTCATVGPCGNYENAPVNDGGPGYYIATDAGVAQSGSFLWMADVRELCYCDSMLGDEHTGWRKVSDHSQCCP